MGREGTSPGGDRRHPRRSAERRSDSAAGDRALRILLRINPTPSPQPWRCRGLASNSYRTRLWKTGRDRQDSTRISAISGGLNLPALRRGCDRRWSSGDLLRKEFGGFGHTGKAVSFGVVGRAVAYSCTGRRDGFGPRYLRRSCDRPRLKRSLEWRRDIQSVLGGGR